MTGGSARHARRASIALALLVLGAASLRCTSSATSSAPPPAGNHDTRDGVDAHATAAALTADPTWSDALSPIRIRSGNTTTLLGNGSLLIAGGGSTPATTEILDPNRATVTLGPEMAVPRTHHTATMLQSGKVLIAGGGSATAELFDPLTRTFSPTGAMTRARAGHAAVRLASGKVLVAGGINDSSAELYDPKAGTFALTSARLTTGGGTLVTLSSGTVLFSTGASSEVFDPSAAGGAGAWSTPAAGTPGGALGFDALTRLRDGNLFVATSDACFSTGTEFCTGSIFFVSSSLSGKVAGLNVVLPTAALLPSGDVVYAGGRPDNIKSALLVPGTTPFTAVSDGSMASGHNDASSVVLPGGDVLVIGGTQAAIDRRTYLGTFHDAAGPMVTARIGHAAVRLQDGRVLVTGGGGTMFAQTIAPMIAAVEIFDPSTHLFTNGGAMTVARAAHTSTTLRSGQVLIVGGAHDPDPQTILASAELYDPSAALGARSHAVGALATPRRDHAATLLPSGKVLITGGCTSGGAGDACAAPTSSAELYDPTTAKFSALPPMTAPRHAHGAVLLPSGKVLLVGGGESSAELFDPVAGTFKATASTGSLRDGRTAHLLLDGRVFVAGGATLAPDIYDPATGTWSFGGPLPAQFPDMLWAMRADGRLLSVGGTLPVDGINSAPAMFDGLARQVGTFHGLGNEGRSARVHATLTLAGSGELVLTGGSTCFGGCIGPPSPLALLHDDGAPASARPTIAAVASTVTAGTKVPLTGTGFTSGPEGSSGLASSSATNHPLALWVSDAGDAVVAGTILDFTDTTATWLVPATALYGHGLLFVSSGGVLSHGASVTIVPAQNAVGCAYDAECATGFCVDGVCCDRRCDGKCEGCTAKRKTSGADGACGAVPPGHDIAGRCFSPAGQACKDGIECATGFCAQGVCCDSSCTGECQSCNQATHAGICSPIMEGTCGAACDGDHTLKQVGVPDVDCAPFKCEGPRCKTTCASVRDCAAPFVCSLEGQCTAAPEPAPGSDSVCGCKVVGGARQPSGRLATLGLALGLGMLGWSRRRRRR